MGRPLLPEIVVSQFQSSTFGESYNAPCSAVSAIAEHLVLYNELRQHTLLVCFVVLLASR